MLKIKMASAYNFNFNKNLAFMLSNYYFDYSKLPFPDFRRIRSYNFNKLLKKICPGQLFDNMRCSKCGAAKFTGTHDELCCGNTPNIKKHLISKNVPKKILSLIISKFST